MPSSCEPSNIDDFLISKFYLYEDCVVLNGYEVFGLCRDGKSRQFGFVGFRTEQEAEEALKYFNKSYLDTCRIICEVKNLIHFYAISIFPGEQHFMAEEGKSMDSYKVLERAIADAC